MNILTIEREPMYQGGIEQWKEYKVKTMTRFPALVCKIWQMYIDINDALANSTLQI